MTQTISSSISLTLMAC